MIEEKNDFMVKNLQVVKSLIKNRILQIIITPKIGRCFPEMFRHGFCIIKAIRL